MEVKPAQRSVEQSFSGAPDASVETLDFGDRPVMRVAVRHSRPANGLDLRNFGAGVGMLVAQLQAAVLNALRIIVGEKARSKSSVMSRVIRKLDSLHAGIDFDVVEVTPESPVEFTGRALAKVYCFDLERSDLAGAADWIRRVKDTNRVVPEIRVVGPRRRLSNEEYGFIAEHIKPLAVYLPRPANVTSSADLVRAVHAEIANVMDPKRLTMESGFEAAEETHPFAVSGG